RAVSKCSQVCVAIEPRPLHAWHLGRLHTGDSKPAADQCFNLEPLPPQQALSRLKKIDTGQVKHRDQIAPKRVIAIAQIGETGSESSICDHVQARVTQTA